ncbi:MAG TPA: S8 family serine peptidase [Pyrinomonadaceae bacterium]|nr:S8 family serine peptidase [Pyrinomonadaceae bacterium]
MKKTVVASLIFVLAVSVITATQPRSAAQKAEGLSPKEAKLIELAARSRQVSADELRLLNSATVNLPLTGREVTTGKFVRASGDEVFSVAFDGEGREVEFAQLRAEEARAHAAAFGKLEPKLHRKVSALGPDARVKVAFWMNNGLDAGGEELRDGRTDLSGDEVETLLARRAGQVRAASARATERITTALLRAGAAVERRGDVSPVVYAELPAGLVNRLAERGDVERVYDADSRNEDYMDVARPSVNAHWVENVYGFNGSGSRIAIVEDSRVDFDNNCLANNLGTRVPGDGNVDTHATSTAGMAASNNATVRGIAPGAGIYSANGTTYSDANMSAAIDAAASNTHISNNSWGPNCGGADGSMNVHARHADYVVRYLWDTVVAAAGNNGTCAGGEFVGGVAAGYNVIAVGNYDDNGTTDSTDNSMNASSSYLDPTSSHGDREKPEVAAPGTNITSLLMASPGECPTGNVGSGTSYSSPIVSGVAAQLMHANTSLRLYPESVKALIMAGATHNIEGSQRLSEFDGVGGVNSLASYTSVVSNRYTWRYVTPSSFDASGFITVDLGWVYAGERLKVALVWDSNPASDYTTDPLNADLDLNVVGPGVSQWSSSWDNSYETVDFTVPASGNYQIKVKNYRFSGASEYFAVAWNRS